MPEHPAAAPSVYESHPQHLHILFSFANHKNSCCSSSNLRSISTICSPLSLSSTSLIFSFKTDRIHPFHPILPGLLFHRILQIRLLNGWCITFLRPILHTGVAPPDRGMFPSVIPGNSVVNIPAF